MPLLGNPPLCISSGQHQEFSRLLSKGIYKRERRAETKSNSIHQAMSSGTYLLKGDQSTILSPNYEPQRELCLCVQRTCDFLTYTKALTKLTIASTKLALTLNKVTMPYSSCHTVAE